MLNLQSRESEAEHLDRALDEALVETFPASDPPAVLFDDAGSPVRAGLVSATSTGDTSMDRIKPLFTATATATGGRDLLECTTQRCPGDALPTMPRVDPEAGDPPVR